MNKYDVNLHFHIIGKARETLGDKIIKIPLPPSGVQFIPVTGDVIKVPGLESFTLVVVAREVSFLPTALELTCYLDTLAHDPPTPDLKLVKQ